MPQFTFVQLRNWKNFTDIKVPLHQRVFLVGPNASGKSNFLDVFRFLHDITAVGGGLVEAVARRGGLSNVRSLMANPAAVVTIRVEISEDDQVAKWTYELKLREEERQRLVVHEETLIRNREEVLLSRFESHDRDDPMRQNHSYLEHIDLYPQLRELADFFCSIRDVNLVPQLVREPHRTGSGNHDAYGSDLVEQIARTPKKTREPRLKRIRDALRVVTPQLKDLELVRGNRRIAHLRVRYENWESPDAWQTEEQFSDGTLRFIGLLWALLDGTGPLLIEHPEQLLHPAVVRYLPGMIWRAPRWTGRQAFITTHSAELFSEEGIGLDEVLILRGCPRSPGAVE